MLILLCDQYLAFDNVEQENVPKVLYMVNRIPLYQIFIALGLRPPGTILKKLRNINLNVDIKFQNVSSRPRFSHTKTLNEAGRKKFHGNVVSNL